MAATECVPTVVLVATVLRYVHASKRTQNAHLWTERARVLLDGRGKTARKNALKVDGVQTVLRSAFVLMEYVIRSLDSVEPALPDTLDLIVNSDVHRTFGEVTVLRYARFRLRTQERVNGRTQQSNDQIAVFVEELTADQEVGAMMVNATVLLAKLALDAKTFVLIALGVLAACNNASVVPVEAVTPLQEAVLVVSGSLAQHVVVRVLTVRGDRLAKTSAIVSGGTLKNVMP